jgi:hypothetical protein
MSCLRLAGFPGNLAQRVDVVNVLVTPHPVVIALAPDSALRAAAYRSWLYELIEASEPYAVRDHLKQERVLGDARFQAMVEKAPARGGAAERAAGTSANGGVELIASVPFCVARVRATPAESSSSGAPSAGDKADRPFCNSWRLRNADRPIDNATASQDRNRPRKSYPSCKSRQHPASCFHRWWGAEC